MSHSPCSECCTATRNWPHACSPWVPGCWATDSSPPSTARSSSPARPRAPGAPTSGAYTPRPSRSRPVSVRAARATTETHATAAVAWLPHHAALLDAVDELHDTAQLPQSTWDTLSVHYEDAQLLELLVLIGWYRTISYLANGLLIEEESWGIRFPARWQHPADV